MSTEREPSPRSMPSDKRSDRASDKRPTIIDVAERAGVSKSVVSLVLRGSPAVAEEKRRRVLDVAAELGYRPNAAARSLVRRRTNLFGIVLSDLHNPFFTEVIDGVEEESARRGYRQVIATVHPGPTAERRALDMLLELRVDGLILASPMFDIDVIASAATEAPVVLVARRLDGDAVDSVSNDDPAGAALVVNYLADLGHTRIAHIDGDGGAGAADRRAGFERTMEQRGLVQSLRVVAGAYTEDGGRHGIAALFDHGTPPTAVFAANDLAAVGALSALSERGIRVPDDVSIVGYDNTSLAALRHINLTTVDQPRQDMGRTAVRLLLERLGGRRSTPRSIVMPPRLVVRGTTAPPPPSGARA